ncbi:septation protein SepH [Schaalia naturae]|uniref:Septation protein SepH n=3 Tax=Schaalia naturae TaxID=635203 RepID=A0ABW2SKC7_9ACTO
MIELDLLGIGADGESLVLTDADGERYVVPITDELRGAVRRDRPRSRPQDAPERALRPRDIQALLRSGLDPDDIAGQYDVDVEHVRRFEAPIVAEREWVLSRARGSHVGGDPDAPEMGDLVVDRLAARGVDPGSLAWSARRGEDGPWEIALTFVQGAAEHAAHWTFSPSGTLVEALDQEARWLTETVTQAPTSSIFTPLPTRDVPDAIDLSAEEADLRVREALLDQLNAARGHRQEIDADLAGSEEEPDETSDDAPADAPDVGARRGTEHPAPAPLGRGNGQGESISARIYSLAHARARGTDEPAAAPGPSGEPRRADAETRSSRPAPKEPADPSHEAAETLPGLEAPAEDVDTERGDAPGRREKRRTRRRSVPSWDEIVFGSRSN